MLDSEKMQQLGFGRLEDIKDDYIIGFVKRTIFFNMKKTHFYKGLSFSDLVVYVKTIKIVNEYRFEEENSFSNPISFAVIVCIDKHTGYIRDAFMCELELGILRYNADLSAFTEAYEVIEELVEQSKADA